MQEKQWMNEKVSTVQRRRKYNMGEATRMTAKNK